MTGLRRVATPTRAAICLRFRWPGSGTSASRVRLNHRPHPRHTAEKILFGALSVLSAPLYVMSVERRALGYVRSRLWLHFLPRAALAAVLAYLSEQLVVSGAPPSWLRLLAALSLGAITYLGVLVATRGLGPTAMRTLSGRWRWR